MKATLHWVSAGDAITTEVRLYEPLFLGDDPDPVNLAAGLNPASLEVIKNAKLESVLASDVAEAVVQFERLGYFYRDADSKIGSLVFNRTVGLRDTWAKVVGKQQKTGADRMRATHLSLR